MTTKAALFALLTVWGVGACPALPAIAGEALEMEETRSDNVRRSIADRVWVREHAADPVGLIRIFLSDGTLVTDSSVNSHRLSRWNMTSATSLTWTDDGRVVAAEVLSVSVTDLCLRLETGGRSVEERYTAAAGQLGCAEPTA